MSEDDRRHPGSVPDRPGRPWLVAAGFLLALALTVLTVLMTGLLVRAPRAGAAADAPALQPPAVAPAGADR